MNLYVLADRLHKTVDEVEHISITEFNEWMAYLSLLNKDQNG